MRQFHILVVDDDPAILEVVARALASEAVKISTARRVAMAREVLMRQPVDLVIADARMPGESGIALACAAREVGVPAILMSGDPEWTEEHGVAPEQYLAKPFAVAELKHRVAASLGGGVEKA